MSTESATPKEKHKPQCCICFVHCHLLERVNSDFRKFAGTVLFLTIGRTVLQELPQKVSVTEVTAEAIRQLMAIAKEVYFPLLTNPGNQAGWPEVITKELIENLHRFMARNFAQYC